MEKRPCRRRKSQRDRRSGAQSCRQPRSELWLKRKRAAAKPRNVRNRPKSLAVAADLIPLATVTGKLTESRAIFNSSARSHLLENHQYEKTMPTF